MESTYLKRYAWKEELFPAYQPDNDLSLIVVVPCFKEPDLLGALQSLNGCAPPQGKVLVIVVINESENASQEVTDSNSETLAQLRTFKSQFPLLVHRRNLPEKKAGVGLARKIGMDEAVRLFRKTDQDGAIICYDADCRCDANYLVEIEKAFGDPIVQSAVIFYEHLLHRENHVAIVNYELYLRFYIDALRFAQFPYAHQTLGSCIAVRSSMYEKVGGMNTRKAGEDFYFLNKTIPQGGFVEINSTTIRPSDRVSDRVPFGTGRAVSELIQLDGEAYEIYHPNTFEDLRLFFEKWEDFWQGEKIQLPMSLKTFLGDDWMDQIASLKSQVGTKEAFFKRFFHWFDAFKILKYVHFCRDEYYQNVELEEALEWLRSKYFLLKGSNESYLIQLRQLDRKTKYWLNQ